MTPRDRVLDFPNQHVPARVVKGSDGPYEPVSYADRLLLVHDVQQRFPRNPDDSPSVSHRWILDHVCPRHARRLGKQWSVTERDFNAWFARYLSGSLKSDDLPTRVLRKQRGGKGRAA